MMTAPQIYILYENEDWLTPLAMALDARKLPWQGWPVIEGGVALDTPAPEGIFFNRLSASAHTRNHPGSIPLGGAILSWLEHHGRRVVNGRKTLDLEVRKFDQYTRLKQAGFAVPNTIAVYGGHQMLEAAQQIASQDEEGKFIIKPNRGGKGLGVRLFESVDDLRAELEAVDQGKGAPDFLSDDGLHLVQRYIRGKDPKILRNEFIGGKYVYSVQVDTSEGFELCPADSCCIADAKPDGEKFKILEGFTHPLKDNYERFMAANEIDVCAFESIETDEGEIFTYDINLNTNYNQTAELACANNPDAYGKAADFLGELLAQETKKKAA